MNSFKLDVLWSLSLTNKAWLCDISIRAGAEAGFNRWCYDQQFNIPQPQSLSPTFNISVTWRIHTLYNLWSPPPFWGPLPPTHRLQ